MWLGLIIVVSISSLFISYGILWYRKGLSSEERYSFKEDFQYSFLTPHWKYSNYFNWNDSKPRKIVPVMLIFGGIGMLVVGLVKIL
jgi:hypothetical protein